LSNLFIYFDHKYNFWIFPFDVVSKIGVEKNVRTILANIIFSFTRVQGTKLFTQIIFSLMVEQAPCPQISSKFDKIERKKIFTPIFFPNHDI
jgi:hypothetical protein